MLIKGEWKCGLVQVIYPILGEGLNILGCVLVVLVGFFKAFLSNEAFDVKSKTELREYCVQKTFASKYHVGRLLLFQTTSFLNIYIYWLTSQPLSKLQILAHVSVRVP